MNTPYDREINRLHWALTKAKLCQSHAGKMILNERTGELSHVPEPLTEAEQQLADLLKEQVLARNKWAHERQMARAVRR